jgi:ABC-2 type transport system ATP-binding protein
MDHLERLSAGRAVTVLLTTHLAEEAERCGTVGIMHEGRLVALDAPGSLRRTIAGEVVLVQPRDPAALGALAEAIGGRYGVEPARDGGALRFELPGAQRIVAELVAAFPEDLSSVTWGRPTLDDVFLRLTGRRLGRAEEAP